MGDSTTLTSCTGTVKLESKTAGEWNHLTMIIDTVNKVAHVYANGIYGWTTTPVLKGDATEIANSSFNYRVTKTTANRQYAICVDNITKNLYSSSYASTDEVFGLDDFLKYDTERNISGVKDIVANTTNYPSLAAPSTIAEIDSVSYDYVGKLLDAINSGDAIKTDSVIKTSVGFNFPKTSLPERFEIIAENGAEVTFEDGALDGYVLEKSTEGDVTVYTVSVDPLANNDNIELYTYHKFNNGTNAFTGINTTTFKYFTAGNEKSADGNGYDRIYANTATTLSADTNALIITAKKGSTTTQRVKSYAAYVVEFDIATGTDYFDGMYISIFSNTTSKYYDLGYIVSDENDKWYFADASTYTDAENTVALPENVEEWTHFTLIAHDDGTNAAIETYINGEYYRTVTAGTGFRMERLCVRFSSGLAIDPAEEREIRIDNVYAAGYGKGGETYASNTAFGIDDYLNLGNYTLPLTFVEDIKFNQFFKFESPNSDYKNLAAEFKALKNGDTVELNGDITLYAPLKRNIKTLNFNGGNVTLIGEAAELYTYENGTLTKKEVYTANWGVDGEVYFSKELPLDVKPDSTAILADFNIYGDTDDTKWYISVNGADKVTLADLDWAALKDGDSVTLTPKYGTVSWYELGGETLNLENQKWYIGEIEPRSFTLITALVPLDNGWYEWDYDAWVAKADGAAANFTALTEGEHRDFVATKKLISALDVKFNYTLDSETYASIYLPDTIDGVTVNSVKTAFVSGTNVGEFKTVYGKKSSIGGVVYKRYNSQSLSVYSWYPFVRFVVSFNVTVGNETVTLTTNNIDLKLPSYLQSVLDTYDCGSVEENLVLNWLQYINYQYAAANNNTLSPADTMLTNHFKKNKTCKNNLLDLDAQVPTENNSELTYGNISADTDIPEEYRGSFAAGYRVLGSSIRLGLYVPKAYADTHENLKIKISHTGIKNGSDDEIMSCEPIRLTKQEKKTVEGVETTVTVDETFKVKVGESEIECYFYMVGAHDISVYNARQVMTIAIYDGETELASGTYTLDEYLYNTVTNLANSETESEADAEPDYSIKAIEALVAFSKASEAYTRAKSNLTK